MRKWLSTLLLILSFSASSQTQPELTFSATQEADTSIGTQMELAREALRSRDYDTAIIILNNVLLSPQNRFTQEAQARIGSAYEATSKFTKAMAEYRAYIAMYPKSDIVPSIKRKLLALEILNPQHDVTSAIPDGPRKISESKVEVSSSTYVIASGNNTTGITNIHANGVFKKDEYTTKVAIREAIKTKDGGSIYSLNVASVEIENNYQDWELKFGRQAADYGVLFKFDGAVATYGYGKDTEYTLILGQPAVPTSTNRRMYGAHIHRTINESYSTTVYYNYQVADGFVERSAIGTEFRYFKDSLSAMVATEYDLAYSQVNSLTLYAHKDVDTYRWFTLYDRRKSPVLFADKTLKLGLVGSTGLPYDSVAEALLRSGMSQEELKDYIVQETAVATQIALGGAIPMGSWTIGGDVQRSVMTGTVSEAQSSASNSVSFSAFNPKAFWDHSIDGILSYTTADDGMYSFTLLDSTMIKQIRLDTTFRNTSKRNKLLSFNTHYKISNKAFLELQLMLNKIRDSIDRTFILGFRYEF
jgi:hypothetical protein